MKKERVVEIFILIFIFLFLLTGAFVFNHYKNEKPNTYNIIFEDIDSIVKGSPVRFMGINVGYVKKLKRKDGYIICKIRITKKNVKIPDGTIAKVAFNGLGGSKSIELLPPTQDNPDIHGIIGTESLRISDFTAVIKDLKDVCIVINNFVQAIDTDLIMSNVKAIVNPEIIVRVDEDIDKMMQRGKNPSKKEKSPNVFSNYIDSFTQNIKKMFNR